MTVRWDTLGAGEPPGPDSLSRRAVAFVGLRSASRTPGAATAERRRQWTRSGLQNEWGPARMHRSPRKNAKAAQNGIRSISSACAGALASGMAEPFAGASASAAAAPLAAPERSRTRGPAGSRSRSGRCPRRPCASAGSASCPRRRPAGPCRRSWPGGGRTAGGWLRSSCLYRAARRRRRGGPRGKARRPYCRWRPAAARTGCRVPPRSGRDGACGSAPGCCGVWVPGSCRRRSVPRLRLRPVGVDGYDVAVRERAELHDIAVVFEAVSDEMGEECARGAIAACIVPCSFER